MLAGQPSVDHHRQKALDEQAGKAEVTDRLRQRFPTVGEDRLTKVVEEGYAEFAGAPIRSFIDVLVAKQAQETLERSV